MRAGLDRRMRLAVPTSLAIIIMTSLGACGPVNHYLAHPQEPPSGVVWWTDDIAEDQLLVHLEIARPPGPGPFPVVMVHPEGGKTADNMRGIIWDLAEHGYLAIAVDYQRWIDGEYRRSLFTWRSPSDVNAALDAASHYSDADQRRIAVIGFSQGGVYSLLIAAYAPERVAAVVAYYPVTDFPHWLGAEQPNPFKQWAFGVVRWYFKRESGAASEAEFEMMLRGASPYYVADAIQAPVLLIHGDHDTTAPLEESRRMADRLAASDKQVKMLLIPNGVHIFNFRNVDQAAVAWQATLEWLDLYLRDGTQGRKN